MELIENLKYVWVIPLGGDGFAWAPLTWIVNGILWLLDLYPLVKKKTENTETESEEEADIEDTETDSAGDVESAETNDSDEADTIYLKPCNTYQDILDNAYEVIVDGRGVDIIASDEVFSFNGIREALYGRDTDEALAGIGYMFYDEDVPWKIQDDYMAQVKKLDVTFFEEKEWAYTFE